MRTKSLVIGVIAVGAVLAGGWALAQTVGSGPTALVLLSCVATA